jgi:hypothetical protein
VKELPPGRTGAARRHMRWAVPLLIGVVGFPVLGALGSQLSANARGTTNIAGSLGGLLLMLLAFVTAIVAAVFFVVGVVRTLSEWRRVRRHAAGKFTQAELEDRARAEAFASSWQNARQLHATLAHRQVPAQIQVWDVVPNAGEAFFYDTSASYARFYGQDVAYNRSGGFFFGHPLFVVAGVALSAAGNAARRSSAEAAAAAQWRKHQTVRLLVSNQRLVCNAGGQWLSFYYSAMTAVYPEVDRWALVCQFDSTTPLLLHGPAVPAAALVTVLMTHGPEAIQQHPSLAPLAR